MYVFGFPLGGPPCPYVSKCSALLAYYAMLNFRMRCMAFTFFLLTKLISGDDCSWYLGKKARKKGSYYEMRTLYNYY